LTTMKIRRDAGEKNRKNTMKQLLCTVICLTIMAACINESGQTTIADTGKVIAPDEGTKHMATKLATFYENLSPLASPYKNAERAHAFKSQAAQANPNQRASLEMRAAMEELLAGNTQKAIQEFETLKNMIAQVNNPANAAGIRMINEFLAVCYLRLGEQTNCQDNHSPTSCIIPLSDEAMHIQKEGSMKAIEMILEVLRSNPQDENFIYILNLAYMTLGQYPDGVPTPYLRKMTGKESPNLIPFFKNKAAELGIDDYRLSGGVVIDDFNNDRLLDIAISSWSLLHPIKIYYNRGNGEFEENNAELLQGITGGLNLIHTDYNNDGFLDLYVLRGGWLKQGPPNSLLRNNGDESFTDVTYETGLSAAHPTQTAVWADFNNDGFLDLYIANESSTAGAHPNELYINQDGKAFINNAQELGAAQMLYCKGTATSDYDHDGDMDIYISVLKGPNYLLQNQLTETGELKFVNKANELGVNEPMESFPCWFFDANNDGWDDIFVSGYSTSNYNQYASEWTKAINGKAFSTSPPKIYINNQKGGFIDKSVSYGFDTPCFTMGANFGDINADNLPDIYLATGEPDYKAVIPNRMFLNIEGSKYTEVTTQGGFGHIQKGHAVSFADIDNDGDEDVYCVLGGAYEGDVFFNALFENPHKVSAWVKFKLQGTASNKAALGTRIILKTQLKGIITQYHSSISNSSSFGENPFIKNFSLQENEKPLSLDIVWPSGHREQILGLKRNTLHIITEKNDNVALIEIPTYKIPEIPAGHQHHHH